MSSDSVSQPFDDGDMVIVSRDGSIIDSSSDDSVDDTPSHPRAPHLRAASGVKVKTDEEEAQTINSSDAMANALANALASTTTNTTIKRISLLAVVVDCTGSMGQYISASRDACVSLIADLRQLYGKETELRVAVVAYRDHHAGEEFETRVLPFTDDISCVTSFINNLQARGGGDAPECVATAFYECNKLDWMVTPTPATETDTSNPTPPSLINKTQITRSVVWITDAPAHGIGTRGDDYPNGDPNGHDPLEIVNEMTTKSISIHSVGCEPTISQYPEAKSMMAGIAQRTNGSSIALDDARDLTKIISGNICRQAQMDDIQEEAVEMIARLTTHENMSESDATEVAFRSISSKMEACNEMVAEVQCSAMIGDSATEFATYRCLAAAVKAVKSAPRKYAPCTHGDDIYCSYRGLSGSVTCHEELEEPHYRSLSGSAICNGDDDGKDTGDMPVYRCLKSAKVADGYTPCPLPPAPPTATPIINGATGKSEVSIARVALSRDLFNKILMR